MDCYILSTVPCSSPLFFFFPITYFLRHERLVSALLGPLTWNYIYEYKAAISKTVSESPQNLQNILLWAEHLAAEMQIQLPTVITALHFKAACVANQM